MLLKLSEKLKVMRTDRPDEWTMDELLRDAVKLEKERDDALAKLAEMESQGPVQWVCELSSNPWPNGGGTRRDTKEDALNYINSESNECGYDTVSPIYRLPVPADKPAVAVDEKTNSRGEPEAIYLQLHNQDSSSETEVADFRAGVTWCWHKINQNDVRYIREDLAAPSHSQQRCSIGQPTSHDAEPQVTIEHNGKCFGVDESISEFVTLLNSVGLETVASCSGHGHRPANIALKDGREIIIARNFDEARKIDRIFPLDINGDRCPSHESEQGGAK